jgi:adenylosuccinate synthase
MVLDLTLADYQWLTWWNSTKLDLLDEFNEIQVGVGCKLDKNTMEYFPGQCPAYA